MYRIFILSIFMAMAQEAFVLIDFNRQSKENWQIVDDVVMGGVSQGNFQINDQGHGLFYGEVSLANKGGFSSVRFELPTLEVSNFSGVRLFVKGDGKPYQFRIRNSYLNRFAYSARFYTSGDWQTIEIPFSSMIATFRGYRLDLPPYEGDKIEEITFLIGNKKEESFELLVDRIELY
jgi:hypothetical protein